MYPDKYNLNTISKTTKDFCYLALLESDEDDINFLEVYNLKEQLKTTVVSTLDRLTQIIEDSNTIINIEIGLFRIEVKHIFQEALLNAISHRDYISSRVIYVKQ